MTRGTFYIILQKKNSFQLVSSCEFNGSMYFENYGGIAINILERIVSFKEFKTYLQKFNDMTFKYEGKLIYPERMGKFLKHIDNGIFIDLKAEMKWTNKEGHKCTFPMFSSDWQFFKNLSTRLVGLKTKDGQLYILKPNEQVALSYGYMDEGLYTSLEHGKEVHKCQESNIEEFNIILNDLKKVA